MNLNLSLLVPEWTAIAVLVIALVLEIFRAKHDPVDPTTGRVTLLGAGLVFTSLVFSNEIHGTAFFGMFIQDPFSIFFKVLFSLTLMVVALMSQKFISKTGVSGSEFYLILWTAFLGMLFLVSANDFLLMFVGLELVALSFYVLAAYLKKDLISIESGLKYLVLGSLASAFMIFGIALLYVKVGSTAFPDIRIAFGAEPSHPLLLLGMIFIFVGLAFKIGAVPFQFWVADVYQGAPTPVVAFLSVGSKAAGIALLLRLFNTVFITFQSGRIVLFTILAALTLIYGNLGALKQTNIKRLFGYSSIGHAGYLLMGLASGFWSTAPEAILYYMIAYGITNLAALYVINIVGYESRSDEIFDYRGLSKRSPWLAATLLIALLSLAGIPPLAGFFGKFLILLAAVQTRMFGLALLGSLMVAVSLFYYLSIIRVMFVEDPYQDEAIPVSVFTKIMLCCFIVSILVVGIYQAPFFELAERAATSLT